MNENTQSNIDDDGRTADASSTSAATGRSVKRSSSRRRKPAPKGTGRTCKSRQPQDPRLRAVVKAGVKGETAEERCARIRKTMAETMDPPVVDTEMERRATGGRPAKYTEDLCDLVIDLGARGQSYTQIAAHLGVCRRTFYNWIDKYEPFMHAATRARTLSQAFWEQEGMRGMRMGKSFNPSMFEFQMKARFGCEESDSVYRDKKSLEVSSERPIMHFIFDRDDENL